MPARITVSTTLPQGVATAVAVAADHEVILHVLDGAEPAVDGLDDSTLVGVPITRSAKTALGDTQLLVVVAETVAQRTLAIDAAHWLPREAVVLLAPGGVFGALEFAGTLRQAGEPDVVVGETTGFMHLGRVDGDGSVRITGVKRDLPTAFYPTMHGETALAVTRSVFPELEPADNVLATSLANTNVVVHPAAALLSAGLIETRGGGFGFYADAFSPGAGRIVERIDAERVALLQTLGLPPISAIESLRRFYADQGMRGETITEMLTTFPPFGGSPAPDSLQHRYFREDVPFGLVPMASLARQIGRPASVMDAVISLCSIACNENFAVSGRSMKSLGLEEMSVADLHELVRHG